jgi:hypothetical protein
MTETSEFERVLEAAARIPDGACEVCPEPERFIAFHRGELEADAMETLRERIARCERCGERSRDARRFLDALAGGMVADGIVAGEGAATRLVGRRRLWAAAAAVIVLGAGVGFWLRWSAPAPWESVSIAKAPYDDVVWRQSKSDEAEFAEAMDPYARGELPAAARTLETFLAAHPGHGEAQFYLGVTFLLLGRPGDAAKLLERAAAGGVEDAPWYLSLALLKAGVPETALASLDRVAAAPGPYQPQAAALAAAIRRRLER